MDTGQWRGSESLGPLPDGSACRPGAQQALPHAAPGGAELSCCELPTAPLLDRGCGEAAAPAGGREKELPELWHRPPASHTPGPAQP